MLQKATLTNLRTGEILPCQFNPGELSLSKQNNWKVEEKDKQNIGATTFGGGNPATLKLELFFDTTHTGQDVRQYTDRLSALMYVESGDPKEPPRCLFTWGTIRSFEGYLKSFDLKLILFTPAGVPLRASASLSLVQSKDERLFPPQNPTSRSLARGVRLVVAGETLDWIAYQEYGASALWRIIAEANQLDDPRELKPGQVLRIPALPNRR